MTASAPFSGEHSAVEHLELLADRFDCLGGQVAYPGGIHDRETIAVASLVLAGGALNQDFRN